MFRMKICGVTSVDDAQAVVAAGGDALGLNFYPLSPRYLEQRVAEQIVARLPQGIARVGVFVNSPVAEVRLLASRLALDFVQLHGDEPAEQVVDLADLHVIRAFRFADADDAGPIANYCDTCQALGSLPEAILIDAQRAGHFGGTGAVTDWAALVEARLALPAIPLILAGGLTPQNVAEAIRTVQPDAVDTASGVESSPGRKSAPLSMAFIAAARTAFDSR